MLRMPLTLALASIACQRAARPYRPTRWPRCRRRWRPRTFGTANKSATSSSVAVIRGLDRDRTIACLEAHGQVQSARKLFTDLQVTAQGNLMTVTMELSAAQVGALATIISTMGSAMGAPP
jgi:hypothetical protein